MIDSLEGVRTVIGGTSMLTVLGIWMSVFRVAFRFRIRRLWWEDAWAVGACFFSITFLVGIWLYLMLAKPISTVGFWMHVFSFNIVIWFVRISVLTSIIRIVYPDGMLRRIMSGLKWMFILMFISLMAAKLWYYVHDLSWMDNELFYGNALLPLGSKVVIYEIVTDFLSDIILIVLPIRLLKNAKLRRRQRRMIFVIFSSIIIVTFAAVFRTYFQLAHVSNMIVVGVTTEIGCSTITLNLLVCVPFIYRYGRTSPSQVNDSDDKDADEEDEDNEDDDFTTPASRHSTGQLTSRVELGATDNSSHSISTRQDSGSPLVSSVHDSNMAKDT